MAFPEDVLTSDEQVARRLRPHWKALIRPALVTVGSLTMLVVGLMSLPEGATGTFSGWLLASLVAVLLAGFAVLPYLRWRSTHYVLTSERVLVQRGILARDRRDLPLARINDHAMTQRFSERLLGCGTLTIESAGERGQIVLVDVPGVERVQTLLYELVEADRLAHSPAGEPPASQRQPGDVAGSPRTLA
ncbi:PH domain-containing protein [Pilimelia columellifera]|uniref:PH domain-containing protein n=1 Tax=Pilimelia columellifera subsp. columellifera TaxID=706583 RepID=A0ABN3NK70_9ACTN